MQIAIITGEASGDRVGGQLAGEIRKLRPDAHIWGTGGKYLREAGAEVIIDSSRWGIIGIVAAAQIMPRLMRAAPVLRRELVRRQPDVLVPVDAGAFNLGFGPIEGLCPWTRRYLPDTRILYYFPPGSWRRTLKGTSLTGNVDRVATPFPWSEQELRRLGVDATFVGHPLLDLVRPSESVAAFAERYGIDPDRPIVGLLPGSRAHEIAQILPVQLAAAGIVHRRVPGVQFVLALAPTVERAPVVAHIERLRRDLRDAASRDAASRDAADRFAGGGSGGGPVRKQVSVPVTNQGPPVPPDELMRRQKEWLRRSAETPPTANHGDISLVIVEDATYDTMAASDVLITASGTATLEAGILGKPMVILYRLSNWNWPEYLLVRKSLPKFIGMPNLLAERRICPEFVQDDATPDALASEVIGLLLEPERMLRMREDLRAAVALLGERGGAARAAQMVVDLASESRTDAGEPAGDGRGT